MQMGDRVVAYLKGEGAFRAVFEVVTPYTGTASSPRFSGDIWNNEVELRWRTPRDRAIELADLRDDLELFADAGDHWQLRLQGAPRVMTLGDANNIERRLLSSSHDVSTTSPSRRACEPVRVDADAQIWVVRLGAGGGAAAAAESAGVAAVGWQQDFPGDVSLLDQGEMQARGGNGGPQLRRFVHDVAVGDVILTPLTSPSLLVGIVSGEYEHRPGLVPDLPHTRAVQWLGVLNRQSLPESVRASLNSLLTIFKPNGREHLAALLAGDPMPAVIPGPGSLGTILDELEAALQGTEDEEPMTWEDAATLLTGDEETDVDILAKKLRSRVALEMRKRQAAQQDQRFFVDGEKVGSTAWEAQGLRLAAEDHRRRIAAKMLVGLKSMDPFEFEERVGVFLEQIGMLNVKVTKRSGDKGIDVFGRMTIHGVIHRDAVVSVKRYATTVGSGDVRDLRGSCQAHQIPILITTGRFTPAALEEAAAPGKVPVSLLDGETLTELMVDLGMGVRVSTMRTYTLDAAETSNA